MNAVLMERGASIAELAENVCRKRPATAQDAIFKLSVLMRAGMKGESIEALREIKALHPQMENYQVAGIYYDACDNLSAWDVAKATVEVFADNVADLALYNRLIKHFLDSGWTIEKVDEWLARMPEGTRNYWVKERLRFNVRHGRGEGLVKKLMNGVRGNPKDIEGAAALLDALAYARRTGDEQWDLSWMAETLRPKRATEAEKVASGLKTLSAWPAAVTFYKQAVDIPLTEEETRKLGILCAVFVTPETLRAMFAVRAREALAECLLKMGGKDEAQKWMVEAADIRKEHDLGLNALLAGEVQAESGQRTIEGRIKEEETKSESDPRYWRERARYYRGRNETGREEEALLKGLALAIPRPETKPRSVGHVEWRSWLLADTAHFLERQKRTGEAVALLRKEIEHAPAASESAKKAARLLAFDFSKRINVDDEVLWNWLANRPEWDYAEERLLWRMLERAKRDDLDRHFVRAEALTRGKDPSRARALGWIMNRMHFPERSIPLLKYAVGKTDDNQRKERAQFTLFESYLDAGDWKQAEGIFPEAAGRLTPKEVGEWYSRVAVAAAKAGATTDAMRIWGRVANLSPSRFDGMEVLVEAGLRDELIDFYREMRKGMPSSEVPARALKALEKK